jgi:hypothetical protein
MQMRSAEYVRPRINEKLVRADRADPAPMLVMAATTPPGHLPGQPTC